MPAAGRASRGNVNKRPAASSTTSSVLKRPAAVAFAGVAFSAGLDLCAAASSDVSKSKKFSNKSLAWDALRSELQFLQVPASFVAKFEASNHSVDSWSLRPFLAHLFNLAADGDKFKNCDESLRRVHDELFQPGNIRHMSKRSLAEKTGLDRPSRDPSCCDHVSVLVHPQR